MEKRVLSFLERWFSDDPCIQVHTSGSTGTPKLITVKKEQMMQSAMATCSFLQLKAGDKALMVLPPEYIGGMMMIVRSLVASLTMDVREPSGHPFADVTRPVDFVALTPMQVYNTLQDSGEKSMLEQTGHIIIGGGAISGELAELLKPLPGSLWSTYGMTETLSHIALRRLNGPQASPYYSPFSHIRLSLSPEETLQIDAPLICDTVLTTNDRVELLPDGRFRMLGRLDNVINTGGLKVGLEELEDHLAPYLSSPFMITTVPDARLGEAIVLLLSSPEKVVERRELKKILPAWQVPHYILSVSALPWTGNGKPNRVAAKKMALEAIEKERSRINRE